MKKALDDKSMYVGAICGIVGWELGNFLYSLFPLF